MTTIAALIVAAGQGRRAAEGLALQDAGQVVPKQYVQVGRQAVLAHTLKPFLAHPEITQVIVVRHAAHEAFYQSAIDSLPSSDKLLSAAVSADKERQASVYAGLQKLEALAPSIVLIHDAARPYITEKMLDDVLASLRQNTAVILASPVTDTIKQSGEFNLVTRTIPRDNLWRAETPQAFRFSDIVSAHRRAIKADKLAFTDDAGLAEWAGLPIALVNSGGANIKITHAADIEAAQFKFGKGNPMYGVPDIRVGQGFDVHRFKAGDHVWICGVKIPHSQGVDAHSDGDVGLHALTDALLGAIADGDIGLHFKNTDPRWKDASSDRFLADARQRVSAAGGIISNVDVTLLCEDPKISPHREAMRARIGSILELDIGRVAIKATTTETMGFTGRREGLAAMASATVVMQPGAR
jgi:2-C-methyl-D-erythritol 4-phosphate cytidylyltransferase / 2-C-methyl-D-erythritol 2,4-cyclodiphosphate synthase